MKEELDIFLDEELKELLGIEDEVVEESKVEAKAKSKKSKIKEEKIEEVVEEEPVVEVEEEPVVEEFVEEVSEEIYMERTYKITNRTFQPLQIVNSNGEVLLLGAGKGNNVVYVNFLTNQLKNLESKGLIKIRMM